MRPGTCQEHTISLTHPISNTTWCRVVRCSPSESFGYHSLYTALSFFQLATRWIARLYSSLKLIILCPSLLESPHLKISSHNNQYSPRISLGFFTKSQTTLREVFLQRPTHSEQYSLFAATNYGIIRNFWAQIHYRLIAHISPLLASNVQKWRRCNFCNWVPTWFIGSSWYQ